MSNNTNAPELKIHIFGTPKVKLDISNAEEVKTTLMARLFPFIGLPKADEVLEQIKQTVVDFVDEIPVKLEQCEINIEYTNNTSTTLHYKGRQEMDEKIVGMDPSNQDDPGFIEVIVLDYANGNAWVYRFSGDMAWEDMEEWLEKNTDFKPTQCEWLIGRKNEKLHVYQALPFPIRKDTKLNSSYSVFR